MHNNFIYKYQWNDNSIYIGKSNYNQNRFGNINEYRKCPLVYNKMKKDSNFSKEILIDNLTELESIKYEKYFIKKYNSFHDNNLYGLNLTEGGDSCLSKSEIVKEKIAKSQSGSKNYGAIKIRNIETNEIFETIKEGATKYNIKNPSSISACLRKKQKTAGGYHWEYISGNIKKYKLFNEDRKKKISEKLKGREIDGLKIICIETMNEYNSAAEAERKTKVRASNILKCCYGKRITAGGYHWKFKEKIGLVKEPKHKNKIICVETKQIYNSLAEIEKEKKLFFV